MALSIFTEARINSTTEWLMHMRYLLETPDTLDFKHVLTPPKETETHFRVPKKTWMYGLMLSGVCLVGLSVILFSTTQYP
jgi:hypothetical protein